MLNMNNMPTFFSFLLLLCTNHVAEASDEWFNDGFDTVPQVAGGELLFLPDATDPEILHSINTLTITDNSLLDGWIQLEQCYTNLDPVQDAEVVYRYRNLRALRIRSHTNIERAFTRGQSVQLTNVQKDASLCIQADVQIFYKEPGGQFVLRNGPFHRKFLDGYFPLHVTLDIRYPEHALSYRDTIPAAQPGFEVRHHKGSVKIDARFAGALNTEVRFTRTGNQGDPD